MEIFLVTDLTMLMLCLGTLAGLGIFVFFGPWLWKSLGLRAKGLTFRTVQAEYILTFLIAGALPLSTVFLFSRQFTCMCHWRSALAFPALASGLVLIPWYVYL